MLIAEKSRQELTLKADLAAAMLVGGPKVRGEDFSKTVSTQLLSDLSRSLNGLAPWYNPVKCS